jgi:ribonuclease P protein component
MSNTFGKEEKLKSRKTIEKLFNGGNSVKAFPLIAVFSDLEDNESHHKVGFSVSKRKFKKAVDRNRIKRKLREVYRLNKQVLLDWEGNKQAIMIIYVSSEDLDTNTLEGKMIKLLERLKSKNSEQS